MGSAFVVAHIDVILCSRVVGLNIANGTVPFRVNFFRFGKSVTVKGLLDEFAFRLYFAQAAFADITVPSKKIKRRFCFRRGYIVKETGEETCLTGCPDTGNVGAKDITAGITANLDSRKTPF